MRDLSLFEQRIDRNMNKPGAGRGQRHDASQLGLRQPGRDPVPFGNALPLQPCRQQADTMI